MLVQNEVLRAAEAEKNSLEDKLRSSLSALTQTVKIPRVNTWYFACVTENWFAEWFAADGGIGEVFTWGENHIVAGSMVPDGEL